MPGRVGAKAMRRRVIKTALFRMYGEADSYHFSWPKATGGYCDDQASVCMLACMSSPVRWRTDRRIPSWSDMRAIPLREGEGHKPTNDIDNALAAVWRWLVLGYGPGLGDWSRRINHGRSCVRLPTIRR